MTALLDVDQLRTFVAIAETGSFTKAAEVVNKTQSAVSMQMKRLEERLERPIFARDGRASTSPSAPSTSIFRKSIAPTSCAAQTDASVFNGTRRVL